MQTTLTYRFPGKAIQSLKGCFRELENPATFEGFIVSNFEGNKVYGFYKNEDDTHANEWIEPLCISEDAYTNLAYEFIHHLQDLSIGKAILSRVKKEQISISATELFRLLEQQYPKAFCYTFDSPLLGEWIGATPEVILEVENDMGKTMSLAGTKPTEDATPWGAKEQHEQQLVTDFIQSNLKEWTTSSCVSERAEMIAGPVKHLVHYFDFQVAASNVWNLVTTLHPTPAVSGFPRENALQCIHNFEPHDRRLYAGIIGMKTSQLTQLFVNLRSAEIQQNSIYIYVGGGLTQASDPSAEWTETENKAKTILRVMND